jgi:hypothetical protein
VVSLSMVASLSTSPNPAKLGLPKIMCQGYLITGRTLGTWGRQRRVVAGHLLLHPAGAKAQPGGKLAARFSEKRPEPLAADGVVHPLAHQVFGQFRQV